MLCQSVQPFDRLPRLLNVWLPNPPRNAPWGIVGEFYSAYVYSQTNPPKGTKCGANRCSRLTAYPVFWMGDPLTHGNAPWGIEGRIVFSLCPFPDESADVYQIWCKSVQPFDSFPILLNIWPPKTPQVPPLCIGGQFIWRISIPRLIRRHEPKLVLIGPAVWQIP